jgi:hypothetical protein
MLRTFYFIYILSFVEDSLVYNLSSNQDICWLVSYCLDWSDLGLSAGWNFFLFKGGRLIRRFQIIWNFLKFVYIRISKHYAEELKIINFFCRNLQKHLLPPPPPPLQFFAVFLAITQGAVVLNIERGSGVLLLAWLDPKLPQISRISVWTILENLPLHQLSERLREFSWINSVGTEKTTHQLLVV